MYNLIARNIEKKLPTSLSPEATQLLTELIVRTEKKAAVRWKNTDNDPLYKKINLYVEIYDQLPKSNKNKKDDLSLIYAIYYFLKNTPPETWPAELSPRARELLLEKYAQIQKKKTQALPAQPDTH